MMTYLQILFWVFVGIVLISLRQVNQYERGVKFTMGRFTGMANPGWRIVWPIFQSMKKVDMRIKAVDVPAQDAITKDNISAKVNAVIYYKVVDAAKSIIEVESVYYATLQLAQTTMRNIVGEVTLDELLSSRQMISNKIEEIVDKVTMDWGVEVTSVELKDINLPTDMIRTIAKQAEAERERRAVIINAEGEAMAAENLVKAASMLASTPGALHLRTLNSINDISSDQSNTVVFTVPLEILKAYVGYKGEGLPVEVKKVKNGA
jgi:regulator of protease activity HflC (stomatin/prohibitin superfamily)